VYLGVPLVDDLALGRGWSMRSWPSSSLTGVESK
jgi:type VI protein secretion system component VasF